MSFRKVLPADRVASNLQNLIQKFHPSVVEKVEQEIQKNKVVVIGMRGNYFVKKAIKNLNQWNIPFQYLEFGSYFSQYNERVTLKMWTGFSTFPMIFINGVLIGGNSDLEAEKNQGNLQSLLKE
jgi:glutaredoxin-related protein